MTDIGNTMRHEPLKWGAILILAGGLIFWAGAFYPPYKQWGTNDIKEYLSIINSFRLNWYIIHGLFLPGIFLSLFGVQLICSLRTGNVFATIASTSFLIGSIFWVLNIAFRLTITVWTAKQLADTGSVAEWYYTWSDWSNLVFALYMVLSYIGIGCLGCAFLKTGLLPLWICRLCIIYGFTGVIGYLIRFPVFAPPLMVYLPFIITGITMIKKKSFG